jgi:hypothetical protein
MDESSIFFNDKLISTGLMACYIFAVIALLTSIGMPIINAIKNPAGLVKALIGVVGLIVLFGISYALSGSEVSIRAATLGVDASSSRLIGAGMIMFYIILISSAVLAIYSLIKDIISG